MFTVLRITLLILVLFLLSSCQPPKYDQDISCPMAKFEARGVTVYDEDTHGFIVMFPGRRTVRVSRESCVIEPHIDDVPTDPDTLPPKPSTLL